MPAKLGEAIALGLTRKRDLRDGNAVWTVYRTPKIPGQRLQRSTKADVVIVGAGISGGLLAQAFVEAGVRPMIVDRRREALLGSTAASTALLQFELDTPLIHLIAAMGRQRAERIWIASRDAINELRTRTHRLGIGAQLRSRPSLYLAGDMLNATALRHEARARQRVGLSSEYVGRQSLRHHFGIERAAALLSHGNAEANPVKLAAGYLQSAIRGGARFYAPHEIVDLRAGRSAVTLVTQDQLEIRARHVVFCTGYELPKIVPASHNRIMSTWAIATRPQPRSLWPQKALIWEASDPYLYARTTDDGRVICGGEDEQFADSAKRDSLTAAKTRRLVAKLGDLFPALDARASFAWTGSFGAGPDGVPTIGAVPGYPNCFAVMGYGGNGITFSMLAASIIIPAVLQRNRKPSNLFAFR